MDSERMKRTRKNVERGERHREDMAVNRKREGKKRMKVNNSTFHFSLAKRAFCKASTVRFTNNNELHVENTHSRPPQSHQQRRPGNTSSRTGSCCQSKKRCQPWSTGEGVGTGQGEGAGGGDRGYVDGGAGMVEGRREEGEGGEVEVEGRRWR